MANKKADVAIVGVGWVGGIIAAELTKAGLDVVGLERGTIQHRSVAYWDDQKHDELRYAIRYELFQNTANETWTFRHNVQENAMPIRQLGAFLPGTGIGEKWRLAYAVESVDVSVDAGGRNHTLGAANRE